jgi:hypothetical protein
VYKSIFIVKIINDIDNTKIKRSALFFLINAILSLIDIDLLLSNKLILSMVKPIMIRITDNSSLKGELAIALSTKE